MLIFFSSPLSQHSIATSGVARSPTTEETCGLLSSGRRTLDASWGCMESGQEALKSALVRIACVQAIIPSILLCSPIHI